jgi:hypothetical protein
MKNLLYLIAVILMASCSTEIKVNADWKNVPVIYGLLDVNDTIHYIKVNKAFLGEAAANDMAQVRDSSEYGNVEVTIERYLDDELIAGSEVVLKDSVFENKDQGVFYSPNQTIYYFKGNLDAQYTYKLNVNIPGLDEPVYAETPLIANERLDANSLFESNSVPLSLMDGDASYQDALKFEWLTIPNGKSYQLVAIFHYDDYYKDSSVVSRSFEIPYTIKKSFKTDGGEELFVTISGEGFYQQIATNIPKLSETKPNNGSDLAYRRFRFVAFDMIVGGDELNTYINVNEPATGILDDKPEYTNITNGIGIFSTRIRLSLKNSQGLIVQKTIKNETATELYIGQYTGELGFCAGGGTYACQ